MTQTIQYDVPIKNLIAELDETGRVIHQKNKKTSVTFHGTDENLDHEGVLNAWRSRGISMHFAVIDGGDICQYVFAEEYACAVGPTQGNESSIHIELVGEISEAMLKATARFTGWLFVYVIDDHPARDNVFTHEHWSPISCLSPVFATLRDMFLEEIQGWYVFFRNQQKAPVTFDVVNVDPEIVAQIRHIQKAFGIRQSGVWGPDMDQVVMEFRRKHSRR